MFDPIHYQLNPYAVPTLITGIAALVLGFWLAWQQRFSTLGITFLPAAVSVAIWQFGTSGVYCSTTARAALAWQKVMFFGVPFIPISLYTFSARFLGLYERRRLVLAVGWVVAGAFTAYALAADGIFVRMEKQWWGYYPVYGLAGIPFLLFYAVLFGACMWDYWREYLAAKPGQRKWRIRLLLIGFSISYIAAADFLPAYGVAIYPFGYAPVLVCLLITAYTVRRYRLVDLVPEFAANEIIRTIADTLLVCDTEGKIRVLNDAACETLGYRAQELLSKPIDVLVGSSKSAAERIHELIARKSVRDEEFVFWTRHGEPVDVSLSVSRIDDATGTALGSVVIAHDIRGRRQAEARLQEEADIALALARAGAKLISVLDRPVVLDQLCALTAELLEADGSYTLLWERKEDVFTPVASYGATQEEREVARLVHVPRSMLDGLFRRLQDDDVTESRTVPSRVLAAASSTSLGQSFVCIALRRADEIVGIQVAVYRTQPHPLTERTRRIARGISQLASFALENARLMAELNEADKVRSEFIATMSHELRTPLGVIIGYTDLLLDGALGELDGEQTEALERVRKNSWDLLELISSTLDLSRLQRGRVPLCLTETNLSGILQQIQEETRAQQDKPGVLVEWRVPENLPSIHTDPSKVKVVLKNLVLNALKFTDSGEVVVEAHTSGDVIECCVRDTGIGIPSEALETIFEPFRQVSGNGRQYGGVGLGLYIARCFLEMLGGQIEVESELGRGSTFRVTLPLASPVVDRSDG